MRQIYRSQQQENMDFLLYRTRYIPETLMKRQLKSIILSIEEAYRARRINKGEALLYGIYMKRKYGLDFEILDDNHIIFLPHSDSLLAKHFFNVPTTLTLAGDTNSGKTITAWTLALAGLKILENATIHIYNDVDGIGTILSEKDSRLVVEGEASVPPMDGFPKIILYNEMTEKQMGKRGMSSANVDLNLQVFRRRHRMSWIIQNVITYSALETLLRQMSTFKVIKWMSPELLSYTIKNLPNGWRKLLEMCAFFGENKGLAIVPIKEKGNIYFIHETNPPKWLLDVHRRADKEKHLLMVGSEHEREYLKIIGEILAVDPKAKSPQVQVIMEKKYGIELKQRRVREIISRWKEITKFEVKHNEERIV